MSSMSVPLYLLTFNCAKLDQVNTDFLNSVQPTLPEEAPTLLVFGFQELVSITDGFFPEQVNKYLIRFNSLIFEALNLKYPNLKFHTVGLNHVGSIGIIVISPFLSRIKNVHLASSGCGFLGSSLKGAVGIRLTLLANDTHKEFTFVVAHLSANEGERNRALRNSNYKQLLRGLDFGDGFSVIRPNTHTFFMGDLNYRALKSGQGNNGDGEENENLLLQEFDDNDELTISRQRKEAFVGFDEAKISFKPTYKLKIGSDSVYNPKRIPSWCDRILFQQYTDKVDVLKYDSIGLKTSDHLPVYLSVVVPLESPRTIINRQGYLFDDELSEVNSIYLKATATDKIREYLRIGSDFVMGWGLIALLTRKGRVASGFLLVFVFILFLF